MKQIFGKPKIHWWETVVTTGVNNLSVPQNTKFNFFQEQACFFSPFTFRWSNISRTPQNSHHWEKKSSKHNFECFKVPKKLYQMSYDTQVTRSPSAPCNTKFNSTIDFKKLATIVSGCKKVARSFFRRKQVSTSPEMLLYVAVTFWHSCLPVFAWRRIVLRFFDPKQLLRVSCILWCYYAKCYNSFFYVFFFKVLLNQRNKSKIK